MIKYLLVLLILICNVAEAQPSSDSSKAWNFYQEGTNAYINKEYKKSIELFLKAVPLPPEYTRNAFYNIGCCYSLLGNADKAIEYLNKSIKAGFADYKWMNADPDLYFLKRFAPEKFKKIIAMAKQASVTAQTIEKEEILSKSPIAVVEYDNYDGATDISDYLWDDYRNPGMDTLREKYHLKQIVDSGKTEFDKMRLMLDWVSNRWEHNGDNCANTNNPLRILDSVEHGETYCCATYANVLRGCLTVLGYPARFVGLSRSSAAYGSGKGHGCVEAWSNQYQKWILLDGQNDAWWEANGIPLSAEECRYYYINKQDDLKFVGQKKDFNYAQIELYWNIYFYHLLFYFDNAAFSAITPPKIIVYEYDADGVLPRLFHQGTPWRYPISDDYTVIYPRLNQTKIRLKHTNLDRPSDTLTVILTHTMPFFDKFMVRFNDSEWTPSGDSLTWILGQGDNRIEAKAVNEAGIEGRVSRIVLRNNIHTIPK